LYEEDPDDVVRIIVSMYAVDFGTKLEGIVPPVAPAVQQIGG
jgi:hypothetical protein